MTRATLTAALALPLALVAGACGDSAPGPAAAAAGRPAAALAVPATLAGLAVRQEPAATRTLLKTARVRDTYATDGVVYGLRLEGELMGVLEIVRLTADARPEEPDFRREIVGQIGGTDLRPTRMSDRLVYRVAGNRQTIHAWFFDAYMTVLILRDDPQSAGKFDAARVLAAALGVRP